MSVCADTATQDHTRRPNSILSNSRPVSSRPILAPCILSCSPSQLSGNLSISLHTTQHAIDAHARHTHDHTSHSPFSFMPSSSVQNHYETHATCSAAKQQSSPAPHITHWAGEKSLAQPIHTSGVCRGEKYHSRRFFKTLRHPHIRPPRQTGRQGQDRKLPCMCQQVTSHAKLGVGNTCRRTDSPTHQAGSQAYLYLWGIYGELYVNERNRV